MIIALLFVIYTDLSFAPFDVASRRIISLHPQVREKDSRRPAKRGGMSHGGVSR
jgi:hypothetical protein